MSSRFSFGMSTPAIRAIESVLLALALLVALVLADNPHHAVTADDLALFAARLDRSSNLHLFPFPVVEASLPRRLPKSLAEPVRDTAPGQVVGGKLHPDPVTGGDADVVDPHFAGQVGEHSVTVRQLDAEHGVGQRLFDHTLRFD